MEYAPVNYSDLLLANGVYFLHPKLPAVIGGEGAGIVEAIGPGVTSVKVGDRVTIPFGTFTWSEKVLAPAQGLFEEFMAQRMGARVSTVAASHASLVSHPKDVAELIALAAASIGEPAA
jgi:NADPH:quinone reductase-like Zn-dependent oxidoreductase